MANSKISALTSATAPLAGTEVLPVVQSGATTKTTVASITGGGNYPGAFTTLSASGISTLSSDNTTREALVMKARVLDNSGRINFKSNDLATTYGAIYWAIDQIGIYNSALSSGVTITPSTGNVSPTGNIVQGTAAKGFDFSANTPAAGKTSTLLNWYEEGTWTPNQGAAVTVVGAFSSSGKYTRIGRQVTVTGEMAGATTIAVVAGDILTSNLPFTCSTNSAGSFTSGVATGGQIVAVGSSKNIYITTAVGASARSIIFTVSYMV